MAITRKKRSRNFTVIGNEVYARNNLSFQAMGLLSYLLSKPDNWSVNVNDLIKVTANTAKKTGKDGVYTILTELRERGYAEYTRHADGKTDWVIRDEPMNAASDNADEGKPHTDKPDLDKPDLDNTDVLIRTESSTITDVKQRTEVDARERAVVEIPNESKLTSVNVWLAYQQAYRKRYQIDPLRNARVNTLLLKLAREIGEADAVRLVEYYVSHDNHFYVKKRHDIGVLVSDAQAVYTDMMIGEQMTQAQASKIDAKAGRGQRYRKVIEEYQAQEDAQNNEVLG